MAQRKLISPDLTGFENLSGLLVKRPGKTHATRPVPKLPSSLVYSISVGRKLDATTDVLNVAGKPVSILCEATCYEKRPAQHGQCNAII